MSGFGELLRIIFIGPPKKRGPKVKRGTTQARSFATAPRAIERAPQASAPTRPRQQKVQLLQSTGNRSPVPYWRLRHWRRVADNLYLGYFKTRLGSCHGVIKWKSQFDYSIYVHDVPQVILNGPHGACFTEVKPKKFRVHFAQQPRDLNSVIFYVETLLQEAFENE